MHLAKRSDIKGEKGMETPETRFCKESKVVKTSRVFRLIRTTIIRCLAEN